MTKQKKEPTMPLPNNEKPRKTTQEENNIDPTFAPNISIFKNLEQRTLVVNESDVKLILNEFVQNKKPHEWISPAGFTLTLLGITLTTKNMEGVLSLPWQVWTAIFAIGTLACAIWLIVIIFQNRRFKSMTVDDLIKKMKGVKS